MEIRKPQANAADFLAELSDEQLRQLLLAQMEADEIDTEQIRRITAVLADREEENGHEIDTLGALETFRREYAGMPALYPEAPEGMENAPKKTAVRRPVRHRRWVRAAVIAAVVATLLFGATIAASASGLNLWGVITRWTADVFGITQESLDSRAVHFEQDDVYRHLKLSLSEHGVYQSVVPNYVPEGYTSVETDASATFEGFYIMCALSNGENKIILRYVLSNAEQVNRYYAIDNGEHEVYIQNGVEHYIMRNEDEYVVSWTSDNIICDISGIPTYEEVIAIINSIYQGGR